MHILQRVSRIIEAGANAAKTRQGRSQIECIRLCTVGYAEPGYDDPKSGVIAFGNWNKICRYNPSTRSFEDLDDTPCRVGKLLETLGVELEWEDEWATCDGCGKAVRIKPNSYSWQAYYAVTDDGITCGDCIQEDPTDYLRSLEGRTDTCITIDLDLEEHGYVLLEDDFEHGLHEGQDADPGLIAKALGDQGIERFLFVLDSTGQFDISFSVWVHQDEFARINAEAWQQAEKDGPSVAEGLRRALGDASRKMAELPTVPGHPKVAKCDVHSGTARVRTVTPQEFVEGTSLDF